MSTHYLTKYWKSFLTTLRTSVIGGQSYTTWQQNYYGLKKVQVRSSPLLRELEKASQKDSFLLFSEVIDIDQFSPHGYHATHDRHAYQYESHHSWAKALARYCQEHSITNVIDVGCGDGNLGIILIKESRKLGHTLLWNGVEVYSPMHQRIKSLFAKHKYADSLGEIASSIDKITPQKKSLLVFFYSLDSMPPELLCTTGNNSNIPDTMIGVVCNDTVLEEKYLSAPDLSKKHVSLTQGIYTHSSGRQFDVQEWKLDRGQRLFMQFNAYNAVLDAIDRFPQPHVAIIDEFYPSSLPITTDHIGFPLNLLTYNRAYPNTADLYKELGENLYYYPLFLSSILSLLETVGFTDVNYDIEERMTQRLLKNEGQATRPSRCMGIMANTHHQKQSQGPLLLRSPFSSDL